MPTDELPAVLLNRPVRVVLSRRKGWRMPDNTVKVSRPSMWGNPFVVTPDRSQQLAVNAYKQWLTVPGITAGLEWDKCAILGNLESLRGKNLACWCKAGTPCHADVLLELANARDEGQTGKGASNAN